MRIFCSICKGLFVPDSEIMVTNCGHIFHGDCISQWCTKHQTCPQCRSSLKTQPLRVYFDMENSEPDVSTLEHQLETITDKLLEHEKWNKRLKEENESYEKVWRELKQSAQCNREQSDGLKKMVKALRDEVIKLCQQNESLGKLQDEVTMWKNKVDSFERIENLLKSSTEEIKKLVETTPVSSQAVKQLCTYIGVLKLQLTKSQFKFDTLLKRHKTLSKSLTEERYKNNKNTCELEDTIKNLRLTCTAVERELCDVKDALKEEKDKYAFKDDDDIIILHQKTVQKEGTEVKKYLFDFDIVLETEKREE